MIVYRIAKSEQRAIDVSGMGAYKEGGRWNHPGTYMLYASENSSLAYLENLLHFEAENTPADLYIISIQIKADDSLIYTLPSNSYPKNWQKIGSLDSKTLGHKFMEERKFLGIKVKSAINTLEHNYLLNPLFPGYHDFIQVRILEKLVVDKRLAYR